MTHLYVISFNNKNEQRKIIINSSTQLKSDEITLIKNNSEFVHNLFNIASNQNKQILDLNWQDLKVELLTTPAPSLYSLSVTEIAIGDLKRLKGPAFSTKLEQLLERKPAQIPVIKFIWKLALAPLISITRFVSKNRNSILRNLKDLDQSFGYDNPQSYLKDYEKHLNFFHSKIDASQPLALHLQTMLETSQSLHQALLSHSNETLIETSKQLAAKAFQALEESKKQGDLEGQPLLSLPGGFYKKGKFHPMQASFYTTKNTHIRLDLDFLGTPPKDLPQTYDFQNLTKEELAKIIFSISSLSLIEGVANPTKLRRREKIRIKVLRQFNIEQVEAPI